MATAKFSSFNYTMSVLTSQLAFRWNKSENHESILNVNFDSISLLHNHISNFDNSYKYNVSSIVFDKR